MSQENVEVVRTIFQAFQERGPSAILDLLATDIEWTVRPDLPDAKTYRGRDGVRQLLSNFEDVMDAQWYSPVEFIDTGQAVVVPLRWGARGKRSEVPFEERQETWMFSLQGGKISRVAEYATRQAAFDAAGVSQ
jgi:ketosteroid isomerase-like protein